MVTMTDEPSDELQELRAMRERLALAIAFEDDTIALLDKQLTLTETQAVLLDQAKLNVRLLERVLTGPTFAMRLHIDDRGQD